MGRRTKRTSTSPYATVGQKKKRGENSGVTGAIVGGDEEISQERKEDEEDDEVQLKTNSSADAHITPDSNLTGKLWDLGFSPINLSRLRQYLEFYPNREDANILYEGFSVGFKLKYNGPRQYRYSNNLKSSVENFNAVEAKLQKEVELGRMIGPFTKLPISNLQISPIGVVPKSDGGWRLITHLSYPADYSINSYIPQEHCTVHYTSFDQVIDRIAKVGKYALLGKQDIKSAFRLLPIFPGDFDLLGICFDSKFYIDKCLPMGCAISCNLFEKFSTFLHWVVSDRTGSNSLEHYLDDFIFIGQPNLNNCSNLMSSFQSVCIELGVPLAPEKTVGPTTKLVFLGLEIDTSEFKVTIPQNKIDNLNKLLSSLLLKKKTTLKELQSLTGALNFICRALRPGRAFLRRFYDSMIGVKRAHHFIRLTNEIKQDISVWLQFICQFNGETIFPETEWQGDHVLQLYSDSAGNNDLGCGAYFSGRWFFFQWPYSWKNQAIMKDITFLELVPIVIAMSVWGFHLSNKKIVFHIDNMSLVTILNTCTSTSKRVMSLVRPFVLYTLSNNIIFRACHIPGKFNDICDSISRKDWKRFRAAAPEAEIEPHQIPQSILDMIYSVKSTDY